MRHKLEQTIVNQAITLVPEFEIVVKKLNQQIILRGQSESTFNNYVRRIAICVIHFKCLPDR